MKKINCDFKISWDLITHPERQLLWKYDKEILGCFPQTHKNLSKKIANNKSPFNFMDIQITICFALSSNSNTSLGH